MASVLCYVPWLGWIICIVILASQSYKTERNARFHAFQGLCLFVGWLIISWVFPTFLALFGLRFLGWSLVTMLKLALLGVWIFMIIKTSQDQTVRLPVIGDLAERMVSEQK
jgi:uncharacterized membrane protein